jgi:dimethylargininase
MLPVTDALVRKVSRSLAACELVHLSRQTIDLARARQQHAEYVRALESCGVRVQVLPEESSLPDATFVEDVLIVLDELTVICRPGAASREPEAKLIERELTTLRRVFRIEAPGSLEGGDVLRVDHTLFVGKSSRTNVDGINQLRRIVASFGYAVVPVTVTGCLHLKTAVTAPTNGLLVANPRWVDLSPMRNFKIISVPVEEPWAANTLPLNDRVLVAASAPRTAERLQSQGLQVETVDVSELQKAEAGLTCLSVLYSAAAAAHGESAHARA